MNAEVPQAFSSGRTPAFQDMEQWMNVKGDLDDFIFYYEESGRQSEK